VPRLVALEATGTAAFVEQLRRAWDAGDAVLPVDARLPPPARERLLTALRAGDDVEPGDALVMATSGTTGEPKGVVLTMSAVEASARATSSRIGVEPGDRWLACLPLSHVGGLSVVTRALITGTPLEVLDGFSPATAMASTATLVSLVPTALGRIDPAHFRIIVLGGQAPPADLAPNVVTTYGMTETGSGVVYDGRPLDGVDIDIAEGGRVRLRGPMLLRCYRGGADPKDADGWLDTGDAGRIDDGGRLVVDGRLSDLIITGGENVWPSAVEQVLCLDPSVGEVAVVGRADPEWGERVVAVVVPAPGAEAPTLDRLRALAKAHLPAYAAPRQLEVVSALPKTALGKTRRASLRRLTAQW
jgi:O-succinylbenzoic acid--CoA ligase